MILERPDLTLITGDRRSSLFEKVRKGIFPAPDAQSGSRWNAWKASTIQRVLTERGIGGVTIESLMAVRAARLAADQRAKADEATQRRRLHPVASDRSPQPTRRAPIKDRPAARPVKGKRRQVGGRK